MEKKTKETKSPTYKNCEKIMDYLKEHKKQGKIGDAQISNAIGMICGSDPRTIKHYRGALFNFGFLKVK